MWNSLASETNTQTIGGLEMAWKKEQEERIELKIWVFKNDFEEYFVEWNTTDIRDDRRLFCNLYRTGLKEFENMKKVKSTFINVAFNEMMGFNIGTMERIVECFNPRGA